VRLDIKNNNFMCGIAGIIDHSKKIDLNLLINKMILKLSHRGPDHKGIWVDKNNNIALANSRLAIQDLSENGNQPFFSPSRNFVIVMNGEIYNHKFLREKIYEEKRFSEWKSNSDTETVSCLLDFYDLNDVLNMLQGMFSLAIYDKKNKLLFLARDKVGEKPLYYSFQNQIFFFSSEIKAILETSIFKKQICLSSLDEYLRLKNIPAPNSIYKDIFKLTPGEYLKFDLTSLKFETKKYWELQNILKGRTSNNIFFFDESKIISETEHILKKSIKKQLISDKPIGCFLSGGTDSSLIASIMSEVSTSKVNTFTVGFDEQIFNEAKIAKEISSHLNTNHHEYFFNESDILNLVENIPKTYDEPFSDSSQLPTMFISKFAKNYVSVALTGDGGDELFCGYNRYTFLLKFWSKIYKLNPKLKFFLFRILNNIPLKNLNIFLNKFLTNKLDFENLINKFKFAFNSDTHEDLYLKLISDFNGKNIVLLQKNKDYKKFYKKIPNTELFPYEQYMYNDFINYLPNDIFTKVDRASMYYSLETRAPFVDSEVIEVAWKYSNVLNTVKEGKWILKRILENYIPKKLVYRSKKGFSVPLNSWLRGPLKNWMLDLLNQKKLKNDNLFDYNEIDLMIKSHLSNKINYGNELWSLCIFQQWKKYYEI
jgi:asparagine synthase (glutamine-hydrolysing)